MTKIKKRILLNIGRIHKKYKPSRLNLRFSFNYLDINEKFHINNVSANYLMVLLQTFKKISGMTVQEFQSNKNTHLRLRTHPIKWEETSEKQGFSDLSEDLVGEPWQFAVPLENARIHGFFIDDVFYIVWLDPDHQLYPPKNKKEKTHDYQSCY